MRSLSSASLLLCVAAAMSAAPESVRAEPQVWFYVTDYSSKPGVDGPQGWQQLFGDPGTPLPKFMSHVDVFTAAGILRTPDDVLRKAFTKLNRRPISFAIESLAQSWVRQPECGQGVESYFDPPGAQKIASKIQSAGGRLAYVAMDEPLFYGHYYGGKNACHSPIENVAERAAAIIVEYKKVFPDVVIGDIEPIPAITSQPNWQADYKQWMKAFAASTGKPIAFVHIDIDWAKPDWQESLREFVKFARGEHLPFGIIYNGDARDNPSLTNEVWLEGAIRRFHQIEGQMGIVPDQVIFHSWDRFPPHSITDQNEKGEDYLILQYARRRARR